jgi:hypothetical protein
MFIFSNTSCGTTVAPAPRVQRTVVLLMLIFAACNGSDNNQTGQDTGTDTGTSNDTGVKPDSGVSEDSGVAADSGDPNDSGQQQQDDAGEQDAGDPVDGGDQDGGVASGACTNPADEMIHTNNDVTAIVEMCASDCFGGRPCTRDCIMMNAGLSMECTECYVDIISCTIQNCIGDCAGSDSAACEMCREESGCTAEFATCSGFSG